MVWDNFTSQGHGSIKYDLKRLHLQQDIWIFCMFQRMNHSHWSHYFLIIFHACWILQLKVVKRFSEKLPKLWSFPWKSWSLASKDSENNAQVICTAFMNSCHVKMLLNYNYAPLKNNCFKVWTNTNNAVVFISIFLLYEISFHFYFILFYFILFYFSLV